MLAVCGAAACGSGSLPLPVPVHQYSYTVVRSYPHSSEDFTQGLVFADDRLYESTGLYGQSAVSIKSLDSGRVIRRFPLPDRYFGEGLAVVNGHLVQLTYREQTGFVYDRGSLELLREFRYKGEGWGLTYDGRHLIMSDGSARLHFLDPVTYGRQRSLKVVHKGLGLENLNELEYAEGRIYANVWLRNIIVEIDPATGHVTGETDLSELASRHAVSPESVLNGIAYNARNGTFLVTGKLWPVLYEIKLHGQAVRAAAPLD
jgi:glutaminyl-peptide cyclotransferase